MEVEANARRSIVDYYCTRDIIDRYIDVDVFVPLETEEVPKDPHALAEYVKRYPYSMDNQTKMARQFHQIAVNMITEAFPVEYGWEGQPPQDSTNFQRHLKKFMKKMRGAKDELIKCQKAYYVPMKDKKRKK
jgi:hypothetical protein